MNTNKGINHRYQPIATYTEKSPNENLKPIFVRFVCIKFNATMFLNIFL